MPPKQKETPLQLFHRAFDSMEDQYFGDAERVLDRADDLGFSADPLIRSARAYWCITKPRYEEARVLALAALGGLPPVSAYSPVTAPPPHGAGNTPYHLVAATLEGVYDFSGAANIFQELLKKNPADGWAAEKLLACCATGRDFKGMQRQAMELTKSNKGEPRLPVATVMALLLQIENRKSLSQEQAVDCLQYKLAQRMMETAIITDANSPPPPVAAAAPAAASTGNKKKKQQQQEKKPDPQQQEEDKKKNFFCPPAVVQIYVDVLRAQKKYAELVTFLLTAEKGKLFGSWSERVFECAKVLQLAGRTAEANSVVRHLWTKVDPDRYDWFELYRDTCAEPVAAFSAPGAAKGETKLECAAGVPDGKQALLDDVLAVAEECKKDPARAKVRTPRLGAISLLTAHVNASGVGVPAAVTTMAELRTKLIAEHVAAMPAKPLLFFDLVKFVGPADADAVEKAGSAVLAQGCCRKAELAADDAKTAEFVKMCVSKWAPSGDGGGGEEKEEADAVASDIFIIAACTACIRRAVSLKKTDTTASSTTWWLQKAAAVAEHALKRFSPNIPHVALLSFLLHTALSRTTNGAVVGDSAAHLRELRLKSMQVDSAPYALHAALRESQEEAAAELLFHGARYHRFLRYDEANLVRASLQNAALPALEDLYANTDKLVRSVARAEHLAFNVLLAKCVKESDTSAQLRQALLGHRMELREEVLFPRAEFDLDATLVDKKQMFAVILQEDPTSAAFDEMVELLLAGNTGKTVRTQQLLVAKLVAAALVTLEHVTMESTTAASKARTLKPLPVPHEEIDKLLKQLPAEDDASFMWQWIGVLGQSASSVLGQERLDRRAATAEVVKLLGIFQEVVEKVAAASSSSPLLLETFLFPILQLIVVSTRVVCDRQPQGVKSSVVALCGAMAKLAESMQQQQQQQQQQSVPDNASSSSSLGEFEAEHTASCKVHAEEMKKRNLARVESAIQALTTVERLAK